MIRRRRPIPDTAPHFLLGVCAGGLVAHEIACELHAAGRSVGLLILVDPTAALPGLRTNYRGWPRRLINLALLEVPSHLASLLRLSGPERWAYVRSRLGRLSFPIRRPSTVPPTTIEAAESIGEDSPVGQALREAIRDHVPRPYLERVVLFQSRRLLIGTHPHACKGWEQIPLGNLVVHRLPWFVGFSIKEPRLGQWIHLLEAELAQAADGMPPLHAGVPRRLGG